MIRNRQARKEMLILMVAALIITGPLMLLLGWGYVGSADLLFYGRALSLFSDAFWSGDVYPRFLANANAGFGSPVFYFYPPAAFYLASLFEPLRALDPDGLYRLALGMAAATWISGLTCRAWLLSRYPAREAFIGALIYVLLPFRLFYLYFDFGLAQCWTLAWFPLLFMAIDRLRENRERAGACCALLYALVLLTHIPSFVVIVPVSFAYAFLCGPFRPPLAVMLKLAAALLLGLGLAAFFAFPLAANQNAIDLGATLDGNLAFSSNFMTPQFLIDAPFVLAAMLFLRKADHAAKLRLRGCFVLILGLLAMMTKLSLPVWTMIAPLRFLQFPVSRFYAPLLVLLVLPGIETTRRLRLGAVPILLLMLYVGEHALYIGYGFYQEGWPGAWTRELRDQRDRFRDTQMIVRPEYRTRDTDKENMAAFLLLQRQKMPLAVLASGRGNVQVIAWEPRVIRLHLHVTAAEDTLLLHRFAFPGWSAAPAPLTLRPAPHTGLMSVQAPQGDYTLTLTQDKVPGERSGQAFAFLSACLTGVWLLGGVRMGKSA